MPYEPELMWSVIGVWLHDRRPFVMTRFNTKQAAEEYAASTRRWGSVVVPYKLEKVTLQLLGIEDAQITNDCPF